MKKCLFSPCNACCDMTSGKGTHLPERKILWAAIVAVLAHTVVASELADRVLIIIIWVEYHYHQHRPVDHLLAKNMGKGVFCASKVEWLGQIQMFVEQFLLFQVQGWPLSSKRLAAPQTLSITTFLFHESFIEVIPSNINLQPLSLSLNYKICLILTISSSGR